MAKRLGPSEFEGKGPRRSGVVGLAKPKEKLRVIYGTEQDPDAAVDLDATPNKFRHGGLEKTTDKIPR